MSKLLRWPVALLLLATTALAIDITTPGQTVPRGDTVGTLQADLSCTPSAIGVFLDNGATLAMNGHVLDGCYVARPAVRGPDEGAWLRADPPCRDPDPDQGTLIVRDVDIQDAQYFGIIGSPDANDGPSNLRLRDVTVTGPVWTASGAPRSMRATSPRAATASTDPGGASSSAAA